MSQTSAHSAISETFINDTRLKLQQAGYSLSDPFFLKKQRDAMLDAASVFEKANTIFFNSMDNNTDMSAENITYLNTWALHEAIKSMNK